MDVGSRITLKDNPSDFRDLEKAFKYDGNPPQLRVGEFYWMLIEEDGEKIYLCYQRAYGMDYFYGQTSGL